MRVVEVNQQRIGQGGAIDQASFGMIWSLNDCGSLKTIEADSWILPTNAKRLRIEVEINRTMYETRAGNEEQKNHLWQPPMQNIRG